MNYQQESKHSMQQEQLIFNFPPVMTLEQLQTIPYVVKKYTKKSKQVTSPTMAFSNKILKQHFGKLL